MPMGWEVIAWNNHDEDLLYMHHGLPRLPETVMALFNPMMQYGDVDLG